MPEIVQCEQDGHHQDDTEMAGGENGDFESGADKEQEAKEVEQIGSEGGKCGTVDVPKGDEPVVAEDGGKGEQCNKWQGKGVETGIVEDVGADREGGVDDFCQAEEEDDPKTTDVFGAVGDDAEKGVHVYPDEEEEQGADEELVEGDLLSKTVDFVPIVFFDSLGDNGVGDGAE